MATGLATLRSRHADEAPHRAAQEARVHVEDAVVPGGRVLDAGSVENGGRTAGGPVGKQRNQRRSFAVGQRGSEASKKGLVDARMDDVGLDVSGVGQCGVTGGQGVPGGADDDSDAIPDIDSGPSEEDEEEEANRVT